ncbi:UDP-2,4-diacetamido-2,4,6-trideoxy-beta-L-altropyranose hydrolase [Aquabacterium sp.]|uniref:UDP-2,4-diacetamido-2,4, 6-trideoxy-beta-L-altropyranose hydrolase n=1 Tax=Aquabacterium sp. TaxID=1872578 RepID=UPI0027BB0D63|nr:UDP-2,4-diacetamido-2,4,6-trideoxy-beta-L-altropyranose hydrolase [Aquabacterium sp.]
MTLQAVDVLPAQIMARRFVFRVDASTEMGIGHLMRCLTLAGRLRARAGHVHFITRQLPDILCAQVLAAGYGLHQLPRSSQDWGSSEGPAHAAWLGASWQEDAQQTAEVIAAIGAADVLVVDHYAIDRRWEQCLREHVRWICVIDDLADRPHDCDVLLDQNYFLRPALRYQGLVPSECRLLLGPGQALLREEFRREQKRLRQRDGQIRRVLIFYGGADPGNLTGFTLNALKSFMGTDLEVDIAVGALNPHIASLSDFCSGQPLCHLHVQTDRMAELMAAADLAFGACGTASWERCAMGLPAIVMVFAHNQLAPTRALAEAGVVLNLGDAASVSAADLADAFQQLRGNPVQCKDMAERALALMQATDAPIEEILSGGLPFSFGDLLLRPATQSDSPELLMWRNQPEVRGNSRTSDVIDPEQHARWLSGVLADPNRHLLIGSRAGKPVGVLRLDETGNAGEVSIYLCPGAYGRGNGSALLHALESWVPANRPAVTHLRAEVLDGNAVSHQLFRKNGYVWLSTHYEKRITR